MKKKKFALATGVISALGLLALVGHKKQVKTQEQEADVLAAVRAFFEPMGAIDVIYVTAENSRAGQTCGGVVFDDGVVFEFRHDKGQIDYKRVEETISHE